MNPAPTDRPIVVAANRLPVMRTEDGGWAPSPGGLVRALLPMLRDTGGTWVGWTGDPDGRAEPFSVEGVDLHPVPITAEGIELFNASTTTAFDLSGWWVSGLDFAFPPGSAILPGQHLAGVAICDNHQIAVEMHGAFGIARRARGKTNQRHVVLTCLHSVKPHGLFKRQPVQFCIVVRCPIEGRD